MAFEISNAILSNYIKSLGHEVPTGNVRLVGIRGAVPHGLQELSLRDNTLDAWNDTIGVWGSEWGLFQGTVDPGAFYTVNPMDPKGAAHLISLEEAHSKPYLFKWGTHKGYRALVQAEGFTLWRDQNRDGKIEVGEPKDGPEDFAIHIHWGGQGASVGKWSAGCQVLFGGGQAESPWERFKGMLERNRQATFPYYLIEGSGLAKYLGLIS